MYWIGSLEHVRKGSVKVPLEIMMCKEWPLPSYLPTEAINRWNLAIIELQLGCWL